MPTNLVAQNNRKISQFWGQKSPIKVSAGPRSLWRFWGNFSLAPSFWWLLTSLSVLPSLQSHAALSHPVSGSFCPLALTRTFVTGLRRPSQIIQDDLISRSLIISAKNPFPSKVTFSVSRWSYFGGHFFFLHYLAGWHVGR